MKALRYFSLVAVFILSYNCSSGGGDDTPPPVEENKAPEKVSTLTYPTNNLLCIDNTLTFQWGASTDPNGDSISYTLEIATDSGFTTIVENHTVTKTSKTVTLDKGKAYYWRVKATDSKNLSSDYSQVYQLYTEGLGTVNHVPFSAELVSPSVNVTVDAGTVELKWIGNDVDNDTLTYDVYFDTNASPTTKVGDNQSENTKSVSVNASTSYYWKVVVKDGSGGESIGQVWSFSTN